MTMMQIGNYTIDIDVEKTRRYYQHTSGITCTCDGCLNFEKAIDSLPVQITGFFGSLGIDMKKVCECHVHCKRDNGKLFYGGFYHLCGRLIFRDNARQRICVSSECWSIDATYTLAPDFNISFQNDTDLLEEGFPLPAIQLDFSADIPWVLDKENTFD